MMSWWHLAWIIPTALCIGGAAGYITAALLLAGLREWLKTEEKYGNKNGIGPR